MLEIIILIFLSRNIAKIASDKGHSGALYSFLTFLFWFGFEILGAFVGFILFGEGFLIYIFALICAIIGYFIIQNIVKNLSTKNESDLDQIN